MNDVLSRCEERANTTEIPAVRIPADCFLRLKPTGTTMYFHAIIEGTYKSYDGSVATRRTLYSVSCTGYDKSCDGTSVDLTPQPDGSIRVSFSETSRIDGAELKSVQNGVAVIEWGQSSFFLDGREGTVEHRDSSGGGKARCKMLFAEQ